MRIISLFFLCGMLTVSAQTQTPAQQAEIYYARGVAAEKAGNAAEAINSYAQALKLNPQHANAQYRFNELKISARAVEARGYEAKYAQIVIPQLALDGASLEEALTAIRLSAEKVAGADKAPNFVIQDPDKKLDQARISLNLKGVPMRNVLGYVLSQGGAQAVYDEHAIVIKPTR